MTDYLHVRARSFFGCRTSHRLSTGLAAFLFLALSIPAVSQTGESPLRTFGYFQTEFRYVDIRGSHASSKSTTFSVPQVNLMLQKDLGKNLTSIIDLEFLNTFSTEQGWGDFNLEEAWVRYRVGSSLSVKFGLSIPVFNNLNELKNRTPILPYIVRPLVYETSFGEFINIEEFVPRRAFIQAFGFRPLSSYKIDYALYVGNSPHVNSDPLLGQTGVDSTKFVLVGGRTGIRWRESLKAGVSFSWDETPLFRNVTPGYQDDENEYKSVPRVRLGFDLSAHLGDLDLEGEVIQVHYVDDAPPFAGEPLFYYGTVGYNVTDKLYVYLSHWVTSQNIRFDVGDSYQPASISIVVPNIGCAYSVLDRVTLKAQFARPKVTIEKFDVTETQLYFSTAVSVFF